MAQAKQKSSKRKQRGPQSAQQTIPYREMHRDGVCHVSGSYYTKTIEYEDINYAVASSDDQATIFDGYCAFLNYFDAALPYQKSFINRRSRAGNRYRVNIIPQDDNLNSIRGEFTGVLKGQIAKSNNGIVRSKYITFGTHAEGVAAARPRLERIEADILSNYKKLGVQARSLDGRERLEVIHGQLHPGGREQFRFSWADIPATGMGTKDFIAPTSFDFRQTRTFRTGQMWGAASYLQIMASELSDKLLTELLEVDAEMTVTMHIQAVDQSKAIKNVKAKISDIDKMKVEEQKKAVRSGYDIDILPPDLITHSKDAAALLQDLQSRNERMFLLTFTIVNTAPTKQQLENDIFTISGITEKYNCFLKRLDFQQEQGYMSSLPLGYNGIEIQRGMTTSSTAIFVPFMTRELRMGGEALYYGQNALSRNIIMADRKRLKSANGLYLGSTGSGKSFAAKRELINVILATRDRVIIVDPMGEYAALVRRLGGLVIEISPDSLSHINPMDIQMNMADEESPLSMKADFLLSLCELIVGGKEGLQPVERTVIDRCVRLVYRDIALGIGDGKMPLLQDLYEMLCQQPEPEARRVATALELYCTGSLNLFNHETNVNLDNRVVCFVLKGRFTRLNADTLGEGYTEKDIHTIIEGHARLPRKQAAASGKVNLIIDIQARMREGKGAGYAQWAKIYNLKQMAAALQYLMDNDITDYEQLEKKAAAASDRLHTLEWQIKGIDVDMQKNAELRSAVVDYAKTRPVFEGYKATKYSNNYLAEHEDDIKLYRAAQATFSRLLNGAPLPKMDVLRQENSKLKAERSSAHEEYKAARQDMKDANNAKANIDALLEISGGVKNKEMER